MEKATIDRGDKLLIGRVFEIIAGLLGLPETPGGL